MIPAVSLKRIIVGLLIATVAIAVIILAMGRFSGRGGGPPPRPAVAMQIGHDSSVEIQPAEYQQFEFRLPSRICTLTGRIEGVSGGNREFEALVLNDDEFRKWPAAHQGGSMRSGRLTAWTPNVTLVGPGRYHLVVSNFFSPPSVKVVTVDGKVVCP